MHQIFTSNAKEYSRMSQTNSCLARSTGKAIPGQQLTKVLWAVSASI